jgi:parallel beta-helix repeat protein
MTKLITAGPLALALSWAIGLAPGAARAARTITVHCGQTLTHSARLANDLTDCPGDGLDVGADDITVDLGGHTIDGTATPDTFGLDVGIRNNGHDGVTVENGTVQEFHLGVGVDEASGNDLRELTVLHNTGRGISLSQSSGNEIEHNTASGNARAAIGLVSSDDNVVTKNTTSDNHAGVFESDSSGNRIDHNVLTGDEFVGIETDNIDHTRFSNNRIAHNPGAMIIVGDDNLVVRNEIVDVPQCEEGGCGIAISVEGGSRNLVAQNTVARAGYIGIKLDDFAPPMTDTLVRDNVVRDAAVDGIGINTENAGPVLNTLLEGNTTINGGDDGINVETPSTTLTANRAINNADLGIEAIPGVTDGGGNIAEANGNPLQCTNVFCK